MDNSNYERKASYSREEILKCCEGELFPSGLPRLPKPPMLMYDRFPEVKAEGGEYGKGFITAEYDIKPDLWFFDCHFKKDPVMPGCLGLDGLWQMLGFYLGWRGNSGKGRALGVKEVKFTGQILPDTKKISYRVDLKKIMAQKLVLGVADGVVYCDDELVYTTKDLKVGLFND